MGKTRLRTVAKIGSLEIKRRMAITLAEEPKPPRKTEKKPPKKLGGSIGTAGNTHYWGGSGTGEHVRKLDGAAGRVIYDKMRRSDPQVQAVLQAVTLPIRKARYYMEPASDEAKDVEIAETIERALFEQMSMTWDDTLRHILLMLPFGFSVLEKVWEVRAGLLLPRKLDPRLPQSIDSWEYDKDKRTLIGPVQTDSDGKRITLPIEKLLVFTSSKEGDNWEGISILRGAYKAWYIKDDLERINAIKHDRHGVGVPVGHMPTGVTRDSPEWSDMEEALESLQANEQGYLVLPEGYEVSLLGGEQGASKGTDVIPSIKYYDEKIAGSVLAMFLQLGQTQTGSRALGASFTDTFLTSLQAYAEYIVGVLNRFLIRELVDFNWAVQEYPVMKVGQIKGLDPTTIATLTKAGVLTAEDELEGAVRSELHLPEKPEDAERRPDAPPPEEEKDEEPEDEADDDEVKADVGERGLRFADREYTDEEKLVDLAGIEIRLNTDTDSLQGELLQIRDTQRDDIIIQLVGGREVQNIRIAGKKDMHSLLVREYKAQFKTGRKEVHDEVERQIGAAVETYADMPVSYDDFLALILEELSIKVEGAADKLKSMLATWSVELKKTGLAGDALRRGLEDRAREQLADITWTNLAKTAVNNGWGDGRQVELRVYEGGVEYYYRSGILDSNICDVCRPKDGRRVDANDPDFMTPDPQCLGGPACRCMVISVMRAESAAEGAV